jgi:SAM-dependent methyltransferase
MRQKIKTIALHVFGERAIRGYDLILKFIFLFKIYPIYLIRFVSSSMTWKIKANKLARSSGGLKLHLGCGEHYHQDMLNCECRAIKAADIVMDCSNLSRFRDNSASLIFSHAFFEHLYKNQQLSLLKDCYRVLSEDGILLFLGIPDFKVIGEHYLSRSPGIKGIGDTFDLYHVYRYTHGDPEIAPSYWLEQLHKSLFDKTYVEELLLKAGFGNYSIFNYCYPGEEIPINMGFAAFKGKADKNIKELLFPFKEYFGNLEEDFQFHLTSR